MSGCEISAVKDPQPPESFNKELAAMVKDIEKANIEGKRIKIEFRGEGTKVVSAFILSHFCDIEVTLNGVTLPKLPVRRVTDTQLKTLELIGPFSESLDSVILKMNPQLKRYDIEYNRIQAALSYQVSTLKDGGLVTTERVKKRLRITRTPIGELVLKSGLGGGRVL